VHVFVLVYDGSVAMPFMRVKKWSEK